MAMNIKEIKMKTSASQEVLTQCVWQLLEGGKDMAKTVNFNIHVTQCNNLQFVGHQNEANRFIVNIFLRLKNTNWLIIFTAVMDSILWSVFILWVLTVNDIVVPFGTPNIF